jgi:hypothetical protein
LEKIALIDAGRKLKLCKNIERGLEENLRSFVLVVKINPQFYWGSGKTEQGYK